MLKVHRFYSFEDFNEYVETFMENAQWQVGNEKVVVLSVSGAEKELGRWGQLDGTMQGVIKERRSIARLTA